MTSSGLTQHSDVYSFIDPSQFEHSLIGRTVLVTGAGRGIGKSIAIAFAKADANVACLARTSQEVDDVASHIRQLGHDGRIISIRADITSQSDLDQAMARIQSELGHIDILINNAGVDRIGSFHEEEDFDAWWRVVEVNLKGSAACIYHVLRHMVQRNEGVIINIGSRNAIATYRFMTAYSASKAALLRLTQCVQLDVDNTNVNVFFVQPGNVATTLADGAYNALELERSPELQGYVERMRQSMTGTRSDSPELVASTCVMLAAHGDSHFLRGLYLDAKQDLGALIAEVKKGKDGRVYAERLQSLKADLL
ncbi:hypothetical protein OQA88_8949 [Cercophora sp. LCS_1]